jgi:integrase
MTGLRQNELFALRWRNIDWLARRIRVVDGYVRGVFNDPKSENSARSVPLASRVAQALQRLYQRSNWTGDDDLVFAHPALGTPLDSSRVLKRLREAEARAGIRRCPSTNCDTRSARAAPPPSSDAAVRRGTARTPTPRPARLWPGVRRA